MGEDIFNAEGHLKWAQKRTEKNTKLQELLNRNKYFLNHVTTIKASPFNFDEISFDKLVWGPNYKIVFDNGSVLIAKFIKFSSLGEAIFTNDYSVSYIPRDTAKFYLHTTIANRDFPLSKFKISGGRRSRRSQRQNRRKTVRK
jgi:hypothetical protein